MPSKKITELTSLTTIANDDIFVVVDVSNSATKNITREVILTSNFSLTGLSSSNIDDAITELDRNVYDISANILSAGVHAFNERIGHVISVSGDYDADQIWFQNSATTLSGDNIQLVINEINDRLIFNTGFKLNITSKTSAYNISETDDVIICGDGDETFTIVLPLNPIVGKVFYVKNVGSGIITCDADSIASTLIDGYADIQISEHESVSIIFDGTKYWII